VQKVDAFQWQAWRWECKDSKRRRYYVVHLRQDLWGGWELHKMWGGLGTRLGGGRIVPLTAAHEAASLLTQCHRRRLSHGYRLVDGELDAV
jgi:hypothetical protein